jgi:hypothetical protein
MNTNTPNLTPDLVPSHAAAQQAPSTLREKAFAALIHLCLSLLATGSLAAAMWFALYPPPFFWIDGGMSVLRILLVVDVILGPALTFVVFNRAKKEWRRDLAIIAIVQVLAFAYGAYTMARYRPVFAVYVDDNFFAVNWPRVEPATQDLAKPRALRQGQWAPAWVALDMPSDSHQAQELRRRTNPNGTTALPGMGDRYVPFSGAVAQKAFGTSADVESLARSNASIAAELARVKAQHPGPLTNYAFLPLAGRDDVILVVFDRQSGKVIDWMR